MKIFSRDLMPRLRAAARAFPALVLTGPRRAGKTHCLTHCFPHASYHLLEDPDVLAQVRGDPRGWLEGLATPAIIDEIQNAPELLPYIRTRVDAAPRKHGRFLITGSQDFALMAGVSESMAGRAAVFQLWPLSARELGRWDLLRGGYPEVWLRPRRADDWFRSYVQTHLERDVRAVTAVRDLATFRRFLALLATRNGQMLNKTELAAPLGVSVPTIGQWISVLETTGILMLVPPWYENLGKRIVKTPKAYWIDTGLLSYLLGLGDRHALERSAMVGPLFEAFIAGEIVKRQLAQGRARELYWFRDHQGLEVDFVVPTARGEIELIEAKWSRTVMPTMARGVATLLPRFEPRRAHGVVVHRGAPGSRGVVAPLVPGVVARDVEDWLHHSSI
jgi:uncharacterized protein